MARRAATVLLGGVAAVAVVAGCWGAAQALTVPRAAPTPTARPASAVRVTPTPTPTATPTPTPTPTVQAVARTCSIAAPARDPRLHAFQGAVLDVKTGQLLFDR